jgi:hypothetical protein
LKFLEVVPSKLEIMAQLISMLDYLERFTGFCLPVGPRGGFQIQVYNSNDKDWVTKFCHCELQMSIFKNELNAKDVALNM